MTRDKTASALTDEQKIAYLAEKVMGWQIIPSPTSKKYDRYIRGYWPLNDGTTRPDYLYVRYWNPMRDWNVWRQVEEKVMEDEFLFGNFILEITNAQESFKGFWEYFSADLPTRVDALIAAHQSLEA